MHPLHHTATRYKKLELDSSLSKKEIGGLTKIMKKTLILRSALQRRNYIEG